MEIAGRHGSRIGDHEGSTKRAVAGFDLSRIDVVCRQQMAPRASAVSKADPDGTDRLIGKTSIAPGGFGSLTRSVAASANFDDFYQIDAGLSIKKCVKSQSKPF